MTWRIDDEDGSLAMTVRLPAAEGQVLVQALRAAAADLDHEHDPGPDAGVSAETPATPTPPGRGGQPGSSGPQPSRPLQRPRGGGHPLGRQSASDRPGSGRPDCGRPGDMESGGGGPG